MNFDPTTPISITLSAAERIRGLIESEGKSGMMFRVAISGGGCSGFSYGFSLDDHTTGEDQVFEQYGVKVVTDEVTLNMMRGSEIDFVEDMVGSSFQIRNPNATSTCGCGSSFSV